MNRTVKDLSPDPKNPRKNTPAKLSALSKTIAEFGPLDGFIENVRTKKLIGGHQRRESVPAGSRIVITQKYEKPTKTGTVATGYVLIDGERHPYRRVSWPKEKANAAMIAANRGAGEWDRDLLSSMLRDLDAADFDLDLTLFDKDELEDLLVPTRVPNFDEEGSGGQAKLDQGKKVECPECGHVFKP